MIADPFPVDPSGQKLCQIFSHRWLAIQGSTEDATNPDWETIGTERNSQHGKFPVRSRSLWAMFQDPAELVGVRFGNTTQYGVIDVDATSTYHTSEGLAAITEALETIGITRTIPIRSSFNGGIHIYIPLPEAVPTFDFAATLKYALEAQELHLNPGQLEIFPNCKSYGRSWLGEFTQYNAHRLPLQPGSGSVMLNHDYQPIGATLQRFFWSWDYAEAAQDMDALTEALTHGRDHLRKRSKLKSHPAAQWRADLELEIMEGWTGSGQTNSLLKAIACYGRVFEEIEGDELAEYVERIAITRPGYLEHCNHQSEIDSKARAWARAAERYYWPISSASKPQRQVATYDINTERAEDAQARIKRAVINLATLGELPDGIRARVQKLCEHARTSAETLYKYLTLWHPYQWCVTPHTEGDTATSPPPPDHPPNTGKPLSDGLLHTPQEVMKGTPPESALKKAFYPGKGGGAGGGKGFPQAEGGA